jgi:copper chaperone CopZ
MDMSDKTIVFDVRGMTCDNCVQHVTKAVRETPGVTGVTVSLAKNSADVAGNFDPVAVIAAIEEEGYEASVRA